MKFAIFSFILGLHSVAFCDFSVKCQFETHETVFTASGEVFSKSDTPYVIQMTDPVLTIGARSLRIQDPVIANRFYVAETCKAQPTLLGYECFAVKNYINGKVPAAYVSRSDRQTLLIKLPVGKGLLGETRFTDIDYYSCPN